MWCHIYRSSIKDGLYVWLRDDDGLGNLPAPVLKQLGQPELAMSIELKATQKLPQEDAETVLANLQSQGYHIQMPSDIESLVEAIVRDTHKPG